MVSVACILGGTPSLYPIFLFNNSRKHFTHANLLEFRKSTFDDARKAIIDDLDQETLPDDLRFYVPKLGPVSIKQEGQLRIMPFLSSAARDLKLENGTSRHPVRVIIQDASLIKEESISLSAEEAACG